ncbi:MAG: glycosyltransferase [Synechococcales bacterium]|nr:glycosyltransferase [Synechococcales bacterium]
MRIAYLTGTYPRATDTFIQREVATLRENGMEVETFSVRPPGEHHIVGVEQQMERDRTTYLLPPRFWPLLIAHLSLLVSAPGRYLRGLRLAWATRQAGLRGTLYQLFYFAEAGLLAHELRSRQVQHLHNHIADSSCTVAMLAAELGGQTFSFTLHGPYIFFEVHRWRLDEKIERALFVACISHYCRSQAMLLVPMTHWAKLAIVHCGVDPALFQLVNHRAGQQRLLYVGRLAAAKGLPVLLESLARLAPRFPELRLTVVGDGGDRPALEQLAQQLHLTDMVDFVGYQSQTTVRQYLQHTDVFVLPSFAEGVPVSLMEAMAAGVPVVTTQIAGISELVTDGVSGYLVPPGDGEALTERIERLIQDPELRSQFGQAGRAMVEQAFNIHQEAAWLQRVMVGAIAGQSFPVRPAEASSLNHLPPAPPQTEIVPSGRDVFAQQPSH